MFTTFVSSYFREVTLRHYEIGGVLWRCALYQLPNKGVMLPLTNSGCSLHKYYRVLAVIRRVEGEVLGDGQY